jgi:hypothetical protein
MSPEANNVFQTLYSVDISDKLEKKSNDSNLLFIKWAEAWAEVKKAYPNATYEILKFGEAQLPYVYDPVTGYMVFTTVTIEGLTHSMWLCVMDGANKAMKSEPYVYTVGKGDRQREKSVNAADMFDINKTIMRCLVKNLAMHGLGLSLYHGDAMSPEAKEKLEKEAEEARKTAEELSASNAKIIALAKKKISQGVDTDAVYQVIADHTGGKKNPNAIKDIETSQKVYKEINAMKAEVKKNAK